jgi:uncharacterized protein YwgA
MGVEKLKAFLDFLEKEAGFRFDVKRFEHRLMLQKYVFIAKVLGLDLGYLHNIYLRGPYSPNLAEDYYKLDKLAEHGVEYEGDYKEELRGFNGEKFLEVIEGKDAEWLEIAATILSVYERYRRKFSGAELKRRIISTSCDIKSTAKAEKIHHVFEGLKSVRLIDA